jgi:tetratricopeptide (TPR) repeat protein
LADRSALIVRTPKECPVGYIMAQNNLANAIRRLAEYHSDADLMAQAVDAYRKAVDVSQLEELSENWPLHQLQLIRALTRLGEFDEKVSALGEARTLANEALAGNPEHNEYAAILGQIDAVIEQLASRDKAQ